MALFRPTAPLYLVNGAGRHGGSGGAGPFGESADRTRTRMEPRPPRSKQAGPPQRSGPAPESGRVGRTGPAGRSGRAPEAGPELDLYGPGAPTHGSEIPLLPRQQRRRRRLARAAAGALVVLVGLGALGAYVGDRIFGDDEENGNAAVVPAGTAPTPLPATVPGAAAPTATRVARSESLIATRTPTPVPPTEPAATDETVVPEAAQPPTNASEEEDAADAAAAPPLQDLLPAEGDVLPGLVLTMDETRSRTEVAGELGTEEAAQLLTDWGWEGNAYRIFVDQEGTLPPGSTTFVTVSVHRFGSAEAATEALTYFSDLVVEVQGLRDVPVGSVGDDARALQGAPDGLPLVVLYVRQGADMFRIGGSSSSAEGDPTPDVLELARTILGE